MLRIAHRGNFQGVNHEQENSPEYIQLALDRGFDVETDLRIVENTRLFLGHDRADHEVDPDWILHRQHHLWIHCKDLQALSWCLNRRIAHAFFHDRDDYTLTTCGKIWTYPGKPITDQCILVMFPGDPYPTEPIYGICADQFD